MKIPNHKQIDKTLAAVDKRRGVLENAVTGVAKGFSSALFVWGPPGLGKSHLLTTMLEGSCGKAWRHHTAYSTPKALMLSLYEEPNAIHLFEDCEKMLKMDLSASLLRAACGSPNERDRWVTYETAQGALRVNFQGGVIIATNANLSRVNGPLQGVASRFRPIKWDLTLEERIALVLHVAQQPFNKAGIQLEAKECRKVALALVQMVCDSRSSLDLDIRLFTEHALPAYAQSKQQPGMKWEDLMLAKLHGVAQTMEESQTERTTRLRQLAQKINAEQGTGKEKVAKWKAATDLGQAIFYRHLRDAKKAV